MGGIRNRLLSVTIVGCVLLGARVAHAGDGVVVVVDLSAEPDTRTEAGAITLVLRSLLGAAKPPLLALQTPDKVVRGAVARVGNQLNINVRELDGRGATLDVVRVIAPSGDVTEAAHAIAVKLLGKTDRKLGPPPAVSLADLRPYVEADHALAAGDLAAAAAALAEADPRVAGLLGDANRVRTELAAKAPPDSAETQAAAVAAAHLRGDVAERDALLAPLLQQGSIPALSFVASLPPATLRPTLEEAALAAAATIEQSRPGLSTRLALRAALGGADLARALPLVRGAEHGAKELEQLVPLVDAAVKSKLAAGSRLRGELRMRAGDSAGAEADLRDALKIDGTDKIALHFLGRVLTGKRDYAGAVTALRAAVDGGDPGATRELARALIGSGDPGAGRTMLAGLAEMDSAESRIAMAVKAHEIGLDKEALAHLAAARALSPDDPDNLRALAAVYKVAGDVARTVEMLGLAERMTGGEAILLASDIAGLPIKAATEVKLEPASQGPVADPSRAAEIRLRPTPLQLEIVAQLLGFETLSAVGGKRVLVVERASSLSLSLFRAHPDVFGEALAKGLTGQPFNANPVVARGAPVAANSDTLRTLAQHEGASKVVLYDVSPSGMGASVRLLAYDVATGRSFELSREYDGARLGLVSVRPALLAAAILLLALLIAWITWVKLIGKGEIDVNIKHDPETTVHLYDVVLTRGANPPPIPDLKAWVAQRHGSTPGKTALRATHVGLHVRFPNVGAGGWCVHLIGSHEKAGELRLLQGLTQRVRVARRAAVQVTFDLVPVASEVRVQVFDGSSPVAATRVAVSDRSTGAVFTDADGQATLWLPKGGHTLMVTAGGMTIERRLQVSDTRTRNVNLNLERERRLASAGDVDFDELGVETELDRSLTPSADGAAPAKQPATPPLRPAAAARAPAAPVSRPAVPVGLAETLGPSSLSFRPVTAARGAPPVMRSESPFLHSESPKTPVTPSGNQVPIRTRALHGQEPSVFVRPAPVGTPQKGTMSISGLSRYQRIEEIGRGAMATVFRARDTLLEREVALKMISDEVRQYPVALQLFIQEAKALAALNHANIVTVFDQGRDEDQYYLVMELVSGTTLERLVEAHGKLPVVEALDTIDQLCNGLAYAHSRRIVHRDIKPGNIFISDEGVVKLGDFGLARAIHEVKIHRTDVRGTPLYMAPEQIRGADIDFRADLYSVGCTLFELLTGQAPFVDGEILYHHLHTPPMRPSQLLPGLPPELDTLVLSCLEKDVNARVASADAIRAALKPLIRRFSI